MALSKTPITSTAENMHAYRLQSVKPSPTLSIMAKAKALQQAGEDIIILAAGEPDFDTPDHIKQAAVRAMDQGLTKYTAVDGMPSLKKAVQQKFQEDNHLTYDLNQLVVGVGGKQLIFNAFLATCNAGDEVIIPAPYWVSYPDMVALCDGVPVCVPCGEEDGFKLTPDALKHALTPRTKWVILNSPSNPTGALYSKEELAALGEVLRHHHALVLSDDIYEYLIYPNNQGHVPAFYNLPMVCPDLKERTLIVNGVSKAYSMTGWRIGYAAGPTQLIQNMIMLQSQSTSNACSIAQAAAECALTQDRSFLCDWTHSFTGRRDACVQGLNAIPGLSCATPDGAFYIYVACHGLIGKRWTTATGESLLIESDADVARFLIEIAKVAVVPGSAFGLSPYFRISYATSMEILQDACARMQNAVSCLV